MAAEYRGRYSTKPVICAFGQGAWAFLCAGGSIPNLPRTTDEKLLRAIPQMKPWHKNADGSWALRELGRQYLVYMSGSPGAVDLSDEKGIFQLRQVNLKTGAVDASKTVEAGKSVNLPILDTAPAVFWLVRES